MSEYLTVTCRLPAQSEERLAIALENWPVLGCQVEDAGHEVDVTVYLEQVRASGLTIVSEGLRALGARDLSTAHFAEQDWLAKYRADVGAMPVGGRFWLDPHPAAPTPPPDERIHLVVEPRQAFGTGSHESTQLVLLLLEEVSLEGRRVLDVGTGSGILGLAARALGASWVVGFDVDLDAACVARQTVAAQLRPLPVSLFGGSISALRAPGGFDVILANLIPAQLEPLLPKLHALLAADGFLIVSGLLADQRTAFEAELTRAHFAVCQDCEAEEWVALRCRHR